MKLLLRIALALVIALAAAGVALLAILRPPAPLALPQRGATLADVTVIEPGHSRAEHRKLVVGDDATIAAVEAASPGARDAYAGMYVLPGLADLHVHFPPSSLPGHTELFAFLYLMHGITAARDAGDVDGSASDPARAGIAEGRFPGPRLFACGPFVDGEPPMWKHSIVALTPDDGRRAVQTIDDRGFDCVKIYNGLDESTLAAIREEAEQRELPVIGHVPYRIDYEIAKLDDAQHLIGIPPRPSDPTTKFPFIMAEWEKLDDARVDRIIEASVRDKIASTPTLVTIDRLIASQDYDAMLREPDVQLLPSFYKKVLWNPVGGMSVAGQMQAADFAMLRRAQAAQKRTMKRMYDAGVAIHSGSDSMVAFVVPGASLHRELRIYVDAGLTPEQALAISTRTSAAFLGVPRLGSLEAGAPAEFVIFREDPTQSLGALDTIAAVVRDGRLYPRAALDEQLAKYQAHFDAPSFEAVVTPLVRRALAATRE